MRNITANTSLYIPEERKKRLKLYAVLNDSDMTECINAAIENYLNQNKSS